MRSIGIVVLCAMLHVAAADLPWRTDMPSPRIVALSAQVKRGEAGAVDRFWQEMKTRGTPLVETLADDPRHVLLTFVYRGGAAVKNVTLAAQLSTSREYPELSRLRDTDVWYQTYWIRSDLRLSYNVAGEGDPLNLRSLPKGWGIGRAYLELPAAAPQYGIVPRQTIAQGKLTEKHIQSKILKAERMAWIYTPAGYDAHRVAPYPLLICFDGSTYTHQIPTPVILDNLIADGKIPPTIAIFIAQSPQPQRNIELCNNTPFADFVAEELLPQVRRGWRVTADPAQTVVCGSSAGGLAAIFFAFHRPDVFGNVLAQSAALWPGKERENPDHEWLIQQYEASPRLPVRFVLQPGVVEVVATPLNGPSILNSNRRFHDVLRKKGYEVGYSEVPGGHEPLTWRGGIAPGLIQLFGKAD